MNKIEFANKVKDFKREGYSEKQAQYLAYEHFGENPPPLLFGQIEMEERDHKEMSKYQDQEISSDADLLLKDINDLASDGLSVEQIAEELNIERAIVKRALETKVKSNPKLNPVTNQKRFNTEEKLTFFESVDDQTRNNIFKRYRSGEDKKKLSMAFSLPVVVIDMIITTISKKDSVIILHNQGYDEDEIADKLNTYELLVNLIIKDYKKKDLTVKSNPKKKATTFLGMVKSNCVGVKANPKKTDIDSRLFKITEEMFKKSYDKNFGHFGRIEKDLFGYSNWGQDIKRILNSKIWWSQEKYPAKGNLRKYAIDQERFEQAYKRHKGIVL